MHCGRSYPLSLSAEISRRQVSHVSPLTARVTRWRGDNGCLLCGCPPDSRTPPRPAPETAPLAPIVSPTGPPPRRRHRRRRRSRLRRCSRRRRPGLSWVVTMPVGRPQAAINNIPSAAVAARRIDLRRATIVAAAPLSPRRAKNPRRSSPLLAALR